MRSKRLWGFLLFCALWPVQASAENRFIVRDPSGLASLQAVCALQGCTVVRGLDGTLNQLFLVTTPDAVNPTAFLNILRSMPGIAAAELDQVISLVGGLNRVPTPLPTGLLSDRTPVNYFGGTVWNSYANQPAARIVRLSEAQNTFQVTGSGIVADIDTGVDPNHPALQPVLLPGYDFTRNQPGGSELNDTSPCPFTSGCPPPPCPTCPPVKVNQSTAAVVDQSTAAVVDGSPYAAFGHGTMVMGIIHLVAPTAMLMPLKAFHSDGTASLSDILRAIYYGVQNKANVINMSFDTKTSSAELQKALDYANGQGVICAASAGNDGIQEIVYPAALQSDVMGVASTSDQDARSSFSNYGSAIVWVAAPGEAIVSTYPFNTYAAGWGTSFSAPFVSGGAVLLHSLQTAIGQSGAAAAVANAVPLDPSLGLNHGRLDLMMTLGSLSGTPDYSVSALPASGTINAGQQANFIVSAAPAHGFDQTVKWTCSVAPAGATCGVSPSSVTLDGSNPATTTATLMTFARGELVTPLAFPRYAPPPQLRLVLVTSLAWVMVLLIVCGSARHMQRRPGLATAAGILVVALCAYSCGGYGSNAPPGPGSPTLSSVGLNPMSVTGGSSSTGTVTLDAPAPTYGATVSLSSNASAATVPASVTVATGATSATFTVSTTAVTASTPVTITSSYGGVTKTASLTVVPQALPTLSSLTLNPTSVIGGTQSSTGTVTLSGPAPTNGVQVLLSSDNGAASVPSSVTVPAAASSATFTVSTRAVTNSTPVTISASYSGVTKTASLAVAPPGTPAGTYMLTITGTSGNLSHSTMVPVKVN